MDTEAEVTVIKEWAEVWRAAHVFRLAAEADCAGPDASDSPGAKLLDSVRDTVIEAVEYGGDRDDIAHEAADQAPDVYTHTMWTEFVDLAAYNEDPSELGADGSDMDQAARICLYMIAERLADVMLADLAKREGGAE